MLVDTDKLTRQDSSSIDVGSKWLKTLVVSKNLRRACSWHRSNKEGVAGTKLNYILTEFVPVIAVCVWFLIPQIELEFSLRKRRSFKSLIGSFNFCDFHWSFHWCMVDCLKDFSVDINSFFTLKGDSKLLESICKTLNSNSYWSMTHVRHLCFFDGVIIAINHSIEIFSNSLSDFMEIFVIKGLWFVISKFWEGNWSQVADSYFILVSVFDDLCAQIRALDCT